MGYRNILRSGVALLLALGLSGFAGAAPGSKTAVAAKPAWGDAKLVAMIRQLITANGYQSKVVITAAIPGHAGQQSVTVMENYQDRESFIIYSKTAEMLLFVCDNGQFRVDYKDHKVYYAVYPSDPAALKAQKERMMALFLTVPVDTFFLKGATVAGRVAKNGVTSYRLTYPKGSMLTGLSFDYSAEKSFFDRITYTVSRPISGSESLTTGEPAMMQQTVVTDHYEHSMPSQIAPLLAATKDLPAYLALTYKGYQLEKIHP